MASLTQDGSKYSHYMSSLQDQWKMDKTGIDFVLNRKFPRDTKDMSLVSTFHLLQFDKIKLNIKKNEALIKILVKLSRSIPLKFSSHLNDSV